MSAAKEPQPLGSRSGKRGYIRICVVCGKQLLGVGRRAKYCPECRAEVYRERARDYRARNPDKVRAAYERRRAAAWTPAWSLRRSKRWPVLPAAPMKRQTAGSASRTSCRPHMPS